MRVTNAWIDANCPLTFAEVKQYRYSSEESLGYIVSTRFSTNPGHMEHLANTLNLLKSEHGDVSVIITTDRVDFMRHRTQAEVLAHESELQMQAELDAQEEALAEASNGSEPI